MDFMYDYGDGLYFNLTNRCPCACTFCVRSKTEALGSADNLWLEHEPEWQEVESALEQVDFGQYSEVVFCGYGEPTVRLELLLTISEYIRKRSAIPIRINTNGLGSLWHGRDIVDDLVGRIDALSVSLNAPNAERYVEICRPIYGEAAFQAMLDFTKAAKAKLPEVAMSVVDVITAGEIDECQELASSLGVPLRVRGYY